MDWKFARREQDTYEVTHIEGNNIIVRLGRYEDILSIDVVVERKLSSKSGIIITSLVGHSNGSYTSFLPVKGFPRPVNPKGENITLVGNVGAGDFNGEQVSLSFGVSVTDEKIREGFAFELDNFHLYEYVKK